MNLQEVEEEEASNILQVYPYFDKIYEILSDPEKARTVSRDVGALHVLNGSGTGIMKGDSRVEYFDSPKNHYEVLSKLVILMGKYVDTELNVESNGGIIEFSYNSLDDMRELLFGMIDSYNRNWGGN